MIAPTHSSTRRSACVAVAVVFASLTAEAQSLADRVASARGTVGFEFTTKGNVCGNGMSINISDDTSPGWTASTRRSGIHIGRSVAGEGTVCEEGPAHVTLVHAESTVSDVQVRVGGRQERANAELGAVSAPEAAQYLLAIAPALTGRPADNAVMGAAIADSASVWKRMLEIARDNDASDASRKASLFWVSQEAGTVATAGLAQVANDDGADASVRSDALFFLAQRPKGEGVPALIRVVRESKSPKLRKDAIFFLSQSRDPRALELFEQLLAGR